MSDITTTNEICCPEFNPQLWQDAILEWNNKKFVKDSVFTFFYIPIAFGKVMTRLDKKVRKVSANVLDWLCLADHTSKWNMDLYLAVDKDIPDANNVTISGKFFSRVYEGNFKDTGLWCNDFEKTTKEKGFKTSKMYMWYTTCPKCAKKYGKNYVVIIAKIN